MAPIKFEDNIRARLEQREIKPSAEAWEKLEAALDQEAKPGDVVEIHRVSESAGSNLAYRVVVEE